MSTDGGVTVGALLGVGVVLVLVLVGEDDGSSVGVGVAVCVCAVVVMLMLVDVVRSAMRAWRRIFIVGSCCVVECSVVS